MVPANPPGHAPLPHPLPRPVEATLSKEKALCDWSKKELRERFDELSKLVACPKHACLKCGRAASKKAVLCKPQALGGGSSGG